MSRQKKLKSLRNTTEVKKIPLIADGQPFIDALDSKLKEFKSLFGEKIEIDSEGLFKQLEQLDLLKGDIDSLRESIKHLKIPDGIKVTGIERLLIEIKRLNSKKIDLSPITLLTDAVGNLIGKIEELKVPEKGQKPEDFLPVRRVVKIGKKLFFDDSYGGVQGGSGGVQEELIDRSGDPSVRTTSSGGGGDATAANQVIQIANQNPLDKYRIADEDSLTTTQYFGFVSSTNANKWVILKVDKTDVTAPVEYSYRYANLSNNATRTNYGAAGATGAWANRTSLTYDYLYNLTGL